MRMAEFVEARLRELPVGPNAYAALLRALYDTHKGCMDGTGYCGDGGKDWDDGCWHLFIVAALFKDHEDFNNRWGK